MSEYICPICGKRVWIKKNNSVYRPETDDYIHKVCPNKKKVFGEDGYLLKHLVSYYKKSCVINGTAPNIPFFVSKVSLYYTSSYDLLYQLNFIMWKYEVKNETLGNYSEFLTEKDKFEDFMKQILSQAHKLGIDTNNKNLLELKHNIQSKKQEELEKKIDLSWI